MSLPIAFWDSSALLPLCVHQPQSTRAEATFKGYGVAVWWLTPVEITSGLTRLQRMGNLGRNEFLIGKQRALDLSKIWNAYAPGPVLVSKACSLLELYPLRAADALQLAAALEACDQKPQGSVFVTADQRLADAARLAGFSVEFV